MLRLGRLAILGTLLCALGGCDGIARYLSGVGDADSFAWERLRPPIADAASEPGSGSSTENRRNRGAAATDAEATAEPKPPPDATDAKTLAQDLRDCESPGLSAAGAAAAGVPRIERSPNSPVVAQCMAEKGYRKRW
jgi:hypothetical protein